MKAKVNQCSKCQNDIYSREPYHSITLAKEYCTVNSVNPDGTVASIPNTDIVDGYIQPLEATALVILCKTCFDDIEEQNVQQYLFSIITL